MENSRENMHFYISGLKGLRRNEIIWQLNKDFAYRIPSVAYAKRRLVFLVSFCMELMNQL